MPKTSASYQRQLVKRVKSAWGQVLFIGFFVLMSLTTSSQVDSARVESLQKKLSETQIDTARVAILIDLCVSYINDDLKKAESFARQALTISEQAQYMKGMALSFRYIGLAQDRQSDYGGAVEYYNKGLVLFETLGDKVNQARMYSNLGSVYESLSNDMKALEHNLKSQKVAEQIDDPTASAERLMAALNNIGVIYAKKPQTKKKALEYFNKALDQATKLNDNELESKFFANIGEIHYDLGEYSKALDCYNKSIQKYNGAEHLPYVLLNKGKIYTQRKDYHEAEKLQREALAIAEKVDSKRDMATVLNALGNTLSLKGDLSGALKAHERARQLSISVGVLEELNLAYAGLAETYSKLGEYQKAYDFNILESEISDSLYNIEYRQQLESFHFDDQIKEKEHKLSTANKDREIAEQLAKRQRFAKNASLVGLGLVIIILFIIFRNYLNKVKINKLLDSQKAKIETLLLNILPASVAKELEKDGQAAPRFYDSVSVLFTDFKDFTKIADGMTPREIVDELNDFFSAFDDITDKHNLEKIKTIGDAYMCAGGIPVENTTHPFDIIRAAFDIVNYMQMKNVIRVAEGKNPWSLRVGIHTGPIAAGVVGKKKYAYDIWGSSVNIASRMESNGEPGKINISSATFELIKDQFKCSYRGKISAKNIGEIDMYFVEQEIGQNAEERQLLIS